MDENKLGEYRIIVSGSTIGLALDTFSNLALNSASSSFKPLTLTLKN